MILDRLVAPSNGLSKASICSRCHHRSLRLPEATSPFTLNRTPSFVPVRHATHGTQGRANGPKNGPGKRLGAKVTGDSLVIPGHIIFRQRGTKWYPGHNVGMGRDHTIYATERGFVKYYRDPAKHPKRRYIGVVFNKTDTLPLQPHAARLRRLGKVAVPRPVAELAADEARALVEVAAPLAPTITKAQARQARRRLRAGRAPIEELRMSAPTYNYRESNWSIGRAAERAGVRLQPFERGNRFLAWRKRKARKERAAERRGLLGQKGGKAPKKAKKAA